jgi:ankyrin repeat protein
MYVNKQLVPSCVEKFLAKGCDINEVDPVLDETLLMHAARIGNFRLLKMLISKKADLNLKNVRFT